MNENSYQTFEYVPASESETDNNHFFVVEDNGSYFTLNRQEQIVLQVQDVNEVLEGVNPCTVYDVPSQQFFVDNSSELIPSTDEFNLPEVNNSLFSQNFLLQQIPSIQEDQTQQNIVEPVNDAQIQQTIDYSIINDADDEEVNNCTEITLSDDQYRILEQKGWILLESNDKILLLDNLGLHDITNDEKLIQNLKEELALILDSNQVPLPLENEVKPSLSFSTSNNNKLELIVDATQTSSESSLLYKQLTLNTKDIQPGQSILKAGDHTVLEVSQKKSPTELKTYKNPKTKVKFKSKNPINIKTNFIFKDIPEKICLGKTPSGKNMIARVIKSNKPVTNPTQTIAPDKIEESPKSKDSSRNKKLKLSEKECANNSGASRGLTESELEKLVQDAIRSNTPSDYEERAALIEPVIIKLLEVESFKTAITDRNLVVTKITRTESRTDVVLSESMPFLVSGRLAVLDGGRRLFIPLPYMLQNLLKQSGKESNTSNSKESPKTVIFTHIHIVETKREGGPVRNAITINKRKMSAINSDKPIVRHVCPGCALVFWSIEELNEHRDRKCIEPEGDLTIDTGHGDIAAYIVKSDEKQCRRTYKCTLCKSEFPSLSSCQRHLKIHNVVKTENEESETQKSLFKCNLCPSIYIYSSSLSKHILKEHIQIT